MNELTVAERGGAVAELVDARKIKEYLDAFGLASELSENETKQFVEVAQAYNLNPFKREIYCIPYGTGDKRKLSIITGYDVYLKRADRTGKLAGWKSWTEGSFDVKEVKKEMNGRNGPYTKTVKAVSGDLRAIVEIRRVDWKEPFVHEVYLDEYAQDNEMWGAKPRTMLKKVAIAQAFRMAFPDEMGGMPYTSDELPDDMTTEKPASPPNVKPAKPAATKPADDIFNAPSPRRAAAAQAVDVTPEKEPEDDGQRQEIIQRLEEYLAGDNLTEKAREDIQAAVDDKNMETARLKVRLDRLNAGGGLKTA